MAGSAGVRRAEVGMADGKQQRGGSSFSGGVVVMMGWEEEEEDKIRYTEEDRNRKNGFYTLIQRILYFLC